MPNTTNPRNSTLAEVLGMAPNARQDAVVAYFHKASAQHNALMPFTSTFDPNAKDGGTRSIFCEKTDLRAGGKSRVHFNTIGMPAGPGAIGAETLVGKESKSSIGNYNATVDWVRDAVSLTQDEVEMIEAGRNLKSTLMQLLAKKMGLTKQNHMLQRLITSADSGNTFRPNSRTSTAQLVAGTDTLSLSVTNICRSLLNTIGATPLTRDVNKVGSPVQNYMLFAGDTSMLPIRNDSLFNTAKDADLRGPGNASFTGRLLDWQGNHLYEFPITDMAWDDYKGGPLFAKARYPLKHGQSSAPTLSSTTTSPVIVINPANTQSRYFQWFDGHPFQFSRQEDLPNLATTRYAWACNPDGSRVFFSYNGLNASLGGNTLAIHRILAPTATAGALQVGGLHAGASASVSGGIITPGGANANLPAGFVYSNTIQPGAVILQANRRGTVYARSFMLGAMAGMFAHGRVKMAEIEQNFDYDYVMGKGFQMIFGTGVVRDPLGQANGYIMIEHAIDVVGYPIPVITAPMPTDP